MPPSQQPDPFAGVSLPSGIPRDMQTVQRLLLSDAALEKAVPDPTLRHPYEQVRAELAAAMGGQAYGRAQLSQMVRSWVFDTQGTPRRGPAPRQAYRTPREREADRLAAEEAERRVEEARRQAEELARQEAERQAEEQRRLEQERALLEAQRATEGLRAAAAVAAPPTPEPPPTPRRAPARAARPTPSPTPASSAPPPAAEPYPEQAPRVQRILDQLQERVDRGARAMANAQAEIQRRFLAARDEQIMTLLEEAARNVEGDVTEHIEALRAHAATGGTDVQEAVAELVRVLEVAQLQGQAMADLEAARRAGQGEIKAHLKIANKSMQAFLAGARTLTFRNITPAAAPTEVVLEQHLQQAGITVADVEAVIRFGHAEDFLFETDLYLYLLLMPDDEYRQAMTDLRAGGLDLLSVDPQNPNIDRARAMLQGSGLTELQQQLLASRWAHGQHWLSLISVFSWQHPFTRAGLEARLASGEAMTIDPRGGDRPGPTPPPGPTPSGPSGPPPPSGDPRPSAETATPRERTIQYQTVPPEVEAVRGGVNPLDLVQHLFQPEWDHQAVVGVLAQHPIFAGREDFLRAELVGRRDHRGWKYFESVDKKAAGARANRKRDWSPGHPTVYREDFCEDSVKVDMFKNRAEQKYNTLSSLDGVTGSKFGTDDPNRSTHLDNLLKWIYGEVLNHHLAEACRRFCEGQPGGTFPAPEQFEVIMMEALVAGNNAMHGIMEDLAPHAHIRYDYQALENAIGAEAGNLRGRIEGLSEPDQDQLALAAARMHMAYLGPCTTVEFNLISAELGIALNFRMGDGVTYNVIDRDTVEAIGPNNKKKDDDDGRAETVAPVGWWMEADEIRLNCGAGSGKAVTLYKPGHGVVSGTDGLGDSVDHSRGRLQDRLIRRRVAENGGIPRGSDCIIIGLPIALHDIADAVMDGDDGMEVLTPLFDAFDGGRTYHPENECGKHDDLGLTGLKATAVLADADVPDIPANRIRLIQAVTDRVQRMMGDDTYHPFHLRELNYRLQRLTGATNPEPTQDELHTSLALNVRHGIQSSSYLVTHRQDISDGDEHRVKMGGAYLARLEVSLSRSAELCEQLGGNTGQYAANLRQSARAVQVLSIGELRGSAEVIEDAMSALGRTQDFLENEVQIEDPNKSIQENEEAILEQAKRDLGQTLEQNLNPETLSVRLLVDILDRLDYRLHIPILGRTRKNRSNEPIEANPDVVSSGAPAVTVVQHELGLVQQADVDAVFGHPLFARELEAPFTSMVFYALTVPDEVFEAMIQDADLIAACDDHTQDGVRTAREELRSSGLSPVQQQMMAAHWINPERNDWVVAAMAPPVDITAVAYGTFLLRHPQLKATAVAASPLPPGRPPESGDDGPEPESEMLDANVTYHVIEDVRGDVDHLDLLEHLLQPEWDCEAVIAVLSKVPIFSGRESYLRSEILKQPPHSEWRRVETDDRKAAYVRANRKRVRNTAGEKVQSEAMSEDSGRVDHFQNAEGQDCYSLSALDGVSNRTFGDRAIHRDNLLLWIYGEVMNHYIAMGNRKLCAGKPQDTFPTATEYEDYMVKAQVRGNTAMRRIMWRLRKCLKVDYDFDRLEEELGDGRGIALKGRMEALAGDDIAQENLQRAFCQLHISWLSPSCTVENNLVAPALGIAHNYRLGDGETLNVKGRDQVHTVGRGNKSEDSQEVWTVDCWMDEDGIRRQYARNGGDPVTTYRPGQGVYTMTDGAGDLLQRYARPDPDDYRSEPIPKFPFAPFALGDAMLDGGTAELALHVFTRNVDTAGRLSKDDDITLAGLKPDQVLDGDSLPDISAHRDFVLRGIRAQTSEIGTRYAKNGRMSHFVFLQHRFERVTRGSDTPRREELAAALSRLVDGSASAIKRVANNAERGKSHPRNAGRRLEKVRDYMTMAQQFCRVLGEPEVQQVQAMVEAVHAVEALSAEELGKLKSKRDLEQASDTAGLAERGRKVSEVKAAQARLEALASAVALPDGPAERAATQEAIRNLSDDVLNIDDYPLPHLQRIHTEVHRNDLGAMAGELLQMAAAAAPPPPPGRPPDGEGDGPEITPPPSPDVFTIHQGRRPDSLQQLTEGMPVQDLLRSFLRNETWDREGLVQLLNTHPAFAGREGYLRGRLIDHSPDSYDWEPGTVSSRHVANARACRKHITDEEQCEDAVMCDHIPGRGVNFYTLNSDDGASGSSFPDDTPGVDEFIIRKTDNTLKWIFGEIMMYHRKKALREAFAGRDGLSPDPDDFMEVMNTGIAAAQRDMRRLMESMPELLTFQYRLDFLESALKNRMSDAEADGKIAALRSALNGPGGDQIRADFARIHLAYHAPSTTVQADVICPEHQIGIQYKIGDGETFVVGPNGVRSVGPDNKNADQTTAAVTVFSTPVRLRQRAKVTLYEVKHGEGAINGTDGLGDNYHEEREDGGMGIQIGFHGAELVQIFNVSLNGAQLTHNLMRLLDRPDTERAFKFDDVGMNGFKLPAAAVGSGPIPDIPVHRRRVIQEIERSIRPYIGRFPHTAETFEALQRQLASFQGSDRERDDLQLETERAEAIVAGKIPTGSSRQLSLILHLARKALADDTSITRQDRAQYYGSNMSLFHNMVGQITVKLQRILAESTFYPASLTREVERPLQAIQEKLERIEDMQRDLRTSASGNPASTAIIHVRSILRQGNSADGARQMQRLLPALEKVLAEEVARSQAEFTPAPTGEHEAQYWFRQAEGTLAQLADPSQDLATLEHRLATYQQIFEDLVP